MAQIQSFGGFEAPKVDLSGVVVPQSGNLTSVAPVNKTKGAPVGMNYNSTASSSNTTSNNSIETSNSSNSEMKTEQGHNPEYFETVAHPEWNSWYEDYKKKHKTQNAENYIGKDENVANDLRNKEVKEFKTWNDKATELEDKVGGKTLRTINGEANIRDLTSAQIDSVIKQIANKQARAEKREKKEGYGVKSEFPYATDYVKPGFYTTMKDGKLVYAFANNKKDFDRMNKDVDQSLLNAMRGMPREDVEIERTPEQIAADNYAETTRLANEQKARKEAMPIEQQEKWNGFTERLNELATREDGFEFAAGLLNDIQDEFRKYSGTFNNKSNLNRDYCKMVADYSGALFAWFGEQYAKDNDITFNGETSLANVMQDDKLGNFVRGLFTTTTNDKAMIAAMDLNFKAAMASGDDELIKNAYDRQAMLLDPSNTEEGKVSFFGKLAIIQQIASGESWDKVNYSLYRRHAEQIDALDRAIDWMQSNKSYFNLGTGITKVLGGAAMIMIPGVGAASAIPMIASGVRDLAELSSVNAEAENVYNIANELSDQLIAETDMPEESTPVVEEETATTNTINKRKKRNNNWTYSGNKSNNDKDGFNQTLSKEEWKQLIKNDVLFNGNNPE